MVLLKKKTQHGYYEYILVVKACNIFTFSENIAMFVHTEYLIMFL